jgi:hypothetical protein
VTKLRVYVEVAPKRSFAGALDWPGWARSGRTEADAIESLVAYGPRYARVVGARAGLVLPADPSDVEVVERVRGGATTEFGAPGEIPDADRADLSEAELARHRRLLQRAWKALDDASVAARGVTLRKGPRGGGRDLDKIREHVFDAESAYVRSLGARYLGKPYDHAALRRRAESVLRAVAKGEAVDDPTAVRRPWPPRYFVRRATWHVLDHAWEIEDRAAPDDATQ